MVYVLNVNGQPLMPTDRHGKVKHLLREGKAKVVKRCPFTIRLLYATDNYKQDITLGIDAGSKMIGLSATTNTKEVYASEVELRNDIVELLQPEENFAVVDETERPDIVHVEEIIVEQRNKRDG